MESGPWLFRNWAVLLCPYDGFSPGKEVSIVHLPIWLQIHRLPDAYCKHNLVEKLLKNSGKILEMRLNGNSRGDCVLVRVRHDFQQPLTKFVSIVKGKERQVFLVRYEKLACFCKKCGLVGHDHKECGSGIHEKKDQNFGAWLYADSPNRPRTDNHTADPSNGKHGKARDDSAVPKNKLVNKEVLDPALSDTVYRAKKNAIDLMEVDRYSRKRFNLDPMANGAAGAPVGLLAMTDGKGGDLTMEELSTSSNGKRTKTDKSPWMELLELPGGGELPDSS